jgi:hypothetical protein
MLRGQETLVPSHLAADTLGSKTPRSIGSKAVRFVSLGGGCQVAHQIIRCFPDLHDSSVFDWLVAPLTSVTRLIGEDFRRFLDGDDMLCDIDVKSGKLRKVVDRFNNISLIHDYNAFDEENDSRVRSKFKHLVGKFRETAHQNNDVVYIRAYNECDGAVVEDSEVEALLARIKAIHPAARLLNVHHNSDTADVWDGDLFWTSVPYTAWWQGDDAGWASALHRCAVAGELLPGR